jgi:hypothetical protein
MLWLSADMRDEWRKLDSIDRHLAAGESAESAGEQQVPSDPPAERAPAAPVASRGLPVR